ALPTSTTLPGSPAPRAARRPRSATPALLQQKKCNRRLNLSPFRSRLALTIRARALELTQQPVAALDRGIHRRLRRFLARERLLRLGVDPVGDQHERAEPQALRILGRRPQRDLLDRDVGAGVAVVVSLLAGQLEGGAGDRQIAGVLVPGGLHLRLRQ